MKKIIFLFIAVSIGLAGCAPGNSLPSTATNTPILTSTLTETALPTEMPTSTAPPETPINSVQVEVVEENREAISDYIFEKIIYPLNVGGKYFQEFGINSIEDYRRVIEENGGMLPASENSIRIPKNDYADGSFLQVKAYQMSNPISINPTINFSNNSNDGTGKGFEDPYEYGYTDNNKVNDGVVVMRSGVIDDGSGINKFSIDVVWLNQTVDLFGKKIPDGETVTNETIAFQADILARSFLLLQSCFPDYIKTTVANVFSERLYSNIEKSGEAGSLFFPFFFKELIVMQRYKDQRLIDAMSPQIFAPAK